LYKKSDKKKVKKVKEKWCGWSIWEKMHKKSDLSIFIF